jgi:hypothetical protein
MHVAFRVESAGAALQQRLEAASDKLQGVQGLLQHFWMREVGKEKEKEVGAFFVFDNAASLKRCKDGAELSEAIAMPLATEHTQRREYELLTALRPDKAQPEVREGLGEQ